MAEAGSPTEDLISQGIFAVITRIDVTYKRELFPGPVIITCENFIIDGKAFQMKQRIIISRGKTAIEAMVESMFMSGETKRAIAVPQRIVEAIRG